MARNMSVALTTQQVMDETKDVTRRLRWLHVYVGDELNLVNKTMGFKKSEKPVVFKRVRVVSIRREALAEITPDDCRREGFPHLTPAEFVAFFCKHNKCTPATIITRIEWSYIQ